MHQYPIRYFSIRRNTFLPEQLNYIFDFERIVGDIKWETGIPGLLIDFNAGIRLQVPSGQWHVRLSDYASGIVGFEEDVSATTLISAEKFYIQWHVEVFQAGKLVFEHTLDLQQKKIFIFMLGSALGDTVALFPYLKQLQDEYGCQVEIRIAEKFYEILQQYFPSISIVEEISSDAYAGYCFAAFQMPPYLIPEDCRSMSLDMIAQSFFRLSKPVEKIVYRPTAGRMVQEKYVCIAVQASGLMKRWLYPDGWNQVVAYLRELGYRVLCIDGEKSYSQDGYNIQIPEGAEDFTGMLPLMERINLLAYADFFIGLGSGLSWLAYACDIPVVLISGFSLPHGEFTTPYRVTNNLVCHGCYNDLRVDWKVHCPYHRGTAREYECSKAISPYMVLQRVEQLLTDREYLKRRI